MAGKLIVSRNSEQDIKIRGLDVFLDGVFLVNLNFGSQKAIDVADGEHTIRITNNLYNKRQDFEVKAGETVRFEVGNVITGIGAFFISSIGIGPYKVFLRRSDPEPNATSPAA